MPYYSPPGNGAMSFSTLSVPIRPRTGTCTGTIGQDYTTANCPAIRDYYDFIRYTQSTQGHLNSQGLCFIDRQYPGAGRRVLTTTARAALSLRHFRNCNSVAI